MLSTHELYYWRINKYDLLTGTIFSAGSNSADKL